MKRSLNLLLAGVLAGSMLVSFDTMAEVKTSDTNTATSKAEKNSDTVSENSDETEKTNRISNAFLFLIPIEQEDYCAMLDNMEQDLTDNYLVPNNIDEAEFKFPDSEAAWAYFYESLFTMPWYGFDYDKTEESLNSNEWAEKITQEEKELVSVMTKSFCNSLSDKIDGFFFGSFSDPDLQKEFKSALMDNIFITQTLDPLNMIEKIGNTNE